MDDISKNIHLDKNERLNLNPPQQLIEQIHITDQDIQIAPQINPDPLPEKLFIKKSSLLGKVAEQIRTNSLQVQQPEKDWMIDKDHLETINNQNNQGSLAQPRRRSLFGQQHDIEINQKKRGSKRNSTKKKESILIGGKKKSSLVKELERGHQGESSSSQSQRLKLISNPLAQQILKQQSIQFANSQKTQPELKNNEGTFTNVMQESVTQSMKKGNESQNSIKINPYDEFTLEDLKVLQDTIQINRHDLQNELIEIQQQKKIKKQITLQPQIAKKWEKVKNQLMAFTVMRKIFSDIKKYGTSMQALSISDQVIEKCRDLLEQRLVEKKQKKSLIYPDSPYLIVWMFVMFFLYCITAIYSPYKIFFREPSNPYADETETYIIDKMIELLFVVNIIVKANTVIQHLNGSIVENRKQIFLKYLKKGFVLDVLQILPYELLGYIYPVLDTYIIKPQVYDEIIRIIRMPFLISSITIDQKVFDYFKIQTTIQRLIRFLFAVGISIHVVGCLWVFTARVQYNYNDNWIKNSNLNIHDSIKVYLFSIYWCLQTLATVGFGDVHACNQAEIIFSLLWMVIGVGFYSFAIGQLSKMFTDSESRQQKLTNSIYIMDEFCGQAILPKHIKDKISKALQYTSNKSILSSTEKEDFFDSIPTKLKTTLAVGMFKGMITAVPFLKNKDNIFLANLLPMLQPLKLNKGDYIYKKDSYPNLVYFIIDGKVNFLIGSNEMVFKSFLAGSYFGEIEIFHQCLRLFNVRCEESCELLTLDRDYFGELMDKFPQVESEMFEMVQRRQELMNESLQKIDMLLQLNENDNFWKNREMKSFADIIMRRKTHSFIIDDTNPQQNQNQVISSEHQQLATHNMLLSPVQSPFQSLQSITDQNKQAQVKNQYFDGNMKLQKETPLNLNHKDSSLTSIKMVHHSHSAGSQGEHGKGNQQNNSLTSINSNKNNNNHHHSNNHHNSNGVSNNEGVYNNQKKKGQIDQLLYKQQGSNSSSQNNLNSPNEPSSLQIIPLISSLKSLKMNNNIVLNVFNEKQEPMLVEVYDEDEVKQTRILQTSQSSSSQNNTNTDLNTLKSKAQQAKGNLTRIQIKYGVSSLDRIEEKNSNIDIENLSNSYFTNEQAPSLPSLTLTVKPKQETINHDKQSKHIHQQKICSIDNFQQTMILPNQLDASVMQTMGQVEHFKKQSIDVNNDKNKSSQDVKLEHNVNGNIKHPDKLNELENKNELKQDLRILLKNDSLQENEEHMNQLQQQQSKEEEDLKQSQPNQSPNYLAISKQKSSPHDLSSPKNLLMFGSIKSSEILDTPKSQISSFTALVNHRRKVQDNNKHSQHTKCDSPQIKEKHQLNQNEQHILKEQEQQKHLNLIEEEQLNLNAEKNESNDQVRINIHRPIRERELTLKTTQEDTEKHINKNILYSDRLDKVYNQVPSLKVIPTQNDAQSVSSSKNRSLQEIAMIETSPEQSPVASRRSMLNFQTRGSRQSIFNQNFNIDRIINDNDNNHAHGKSIEFRHKTKRSSKNKYERYQKTQTNINADSDEEKQNRQKQLRQIKTISNIQFHNTDESIQVPIYQNKSNITDDKSKDFDIQSLNYLAKNECTTPRSEISFVDIKNIIKEDELTFNITESVNVDIKDLQESQSIEKSKKKKNQTQQLALKKSNHKDDIKNSDNLLLPTKNEKEKKRRTRSSNDRESRSKSKSQSSYKTDEIYPEKAEKKELKQFDKFDIEISKKNSKSSNHKSKNDEIKTEHKKQKDNKVKQGKSNKTVIKSEDKQKPKNKFNTQNSFQIQDMMKPIENDLEQLNQRKTRTLFRQMSQRIKGQNNHQEDSEDQEDSSQDDIEQKEEYLNSNQRKQKLDYIRERRKREKSQTNMFEERIKLLNKMSSVQSSKNSIHSPQSRHNLQHSDSILSNKFDTLHESSRQKQKSIDKAIKPQRTSHIALEEEDTKNKQLILKKDQLQISQKSHKKNKNYLQTKHKSAEQNMNESKNLKNEISNNIKQKQTNNTNQMRSQAKEMSISREMKRMQKVHQEEILEVKDNVSDISSKLDSLTLQYENVLNLVSSLTQSIKQMHQVEEQDTLHNQFKLRQIKSLPFPSIKNSVHKSAIQQKEMDELDQILNDLNLMQSPRNINTLSMRQRNNSSDSNQSEKNTKRILLTLGKNKSYSKADDDDDDNNNDNNDNNNNNNNNDDDDDFNQF